MSWPRSFDPAARAPSRSRRSRRASGCIPSRRRSAWPRSCAPRSPCGAPHERTGPEIVHANSTRAGLAAILATRAGGPPVVVYVKDCLPAGRAADLTRRCIAQGAALVLANSRLHGGQLSARQPRAPARGRVQPDRPRAGRPRADRARPGARPPRPGARCPLARRPRADHALEGAVDGDRGARAAEGARARGEALAGRERQVHRRRHALRQRRLPALAPRACRQARPRGGREVHGRAQRRPGRTCCAPWTSCWRRPGRSRSEGPWSRRWRWERP